MELPSLFELHEINRLLYTVMQLSQKTGTCSVKATIRTCSSTVYAGRIINHFELIRLCHYSEMLILYQSNLKLTNLGYQFLSLNPERKFELTNEQKTFFVEKVLFEGRWKSQVRDLFLSFTLNTGNFTFELSTSINNLPLRYNATIHLLKALDVLVEDNSMLHVTPLYVKWVGRIRGKSDEELRQSLSANLKLADLAEEAVVEYERQRLKKLGRIIESESVRRISQLDVAAGYDIESFDGDNPQLQYNRFIEVKASKQKNLRFFWTANEKSVADKLNEQYWIYFVGGLVGNTNSIEPILIQNPAKKLFMMPQLNIEVSQYIISEEEPLPLTRLSEEENKGYLL